MTLISTVHFLVLTQLGYFFYLAVGRGFGAGAGWSLSLHLRSCLGDTDPDEVDDVVQIGEEVRAREPAVMAMLLNARFLELLEPV